MKKVDLIVYKDKIKKLHKAAITMKNAHDEYETFENEKLLDDDFDMKTDWKKLTTFMEANPDLTDKISEVETIIDGLTH